MAKLMFVVMVLYAKEDRKAQIPEWMLAKAAYKEDFDAFPWGTWAFMHSLKVLEKNLCGKMKRLDEGGSKSFTYGGFVLAIPILVYECIPSFATKFARRRSQMIPPVPRICLWKTRFSKTKPTNVEVNEALLSVTELQSILVPDEVETRAEWMSTFHSLISTRHEAIDDYVKVLEECVTTVSLKREHNYDTKRSEKKIKTSSPKNVPLAPHLVKDTASSPSIGEGPPVPHVGCCLQPKSMATPSGHSHTHDSESEYRIKEYIDKKIDLLRDEFKSKNDVIIKLLEKLIARGDVVEVEKVTSNKISEMSSMKRENVEKENTLEDNMVADDLVLDEQDHLRDENVAGEQSSLYHVRGEEEVGKEVLGRGRRKKVESSLLHTPWTRNNPKKKPKRVISLSTPKEEKLRFVELLIQQRLEQKVGIECHMEERFEISGIGKRWWTQLITPGEWIETTHMGEYLYVLRRRAFYESHIMKMDTFVLNEYFSAWCERSHITYPVIGDRLEKYIKGELKIPFLKPWTKEIRSVYFPYSIDSGHWVAIRADFDTGCLTVFDSLKSHCTDSYLDILLSRLRRIFPVLAMTSGLDSHTMTTKPIWDVCRPCVPQQTTNDCGVFALKFIELDMQGVGFDSLKGLQREDMKRLRLQIAYHICKEIKNKP
ncbi:unnamed protein product [Cuscuta epithymum]|nr:unnamed protein product [Cuscuta epithymum]